MASTVFQRTAEARCQFFERDRLPGADAVPAAILQSWQRCRSMGLPAERGPVVEPVPMPRLLEMRERSEQLWRLARAELDALSSDAKAAGSIVLLTDAKGWILDAAGSPQFLDKAGRVALMPGACWDETATGTNAIGTAIATGAAVRVHGGQHYLASNRILSCTAAPIHDPFGQLVGVLDISGEASVEHMHALGLARLAVANIEHRYFDAGLPGCTLLRVHRDPGQLGSAHEGLLAFKGQRLVAANQAGLRLFGLERADLGRTLYGELLEDSLDTLRSQHVVYDRHGQVLHGRVHAEHQTTRRPVRTPPITVSAAPDNPDGPLLDAALDAQLAQATRVLNAELPVLVQGETGCGKEVFARELHRRSQRGHKSFVAVNCAALPEGLIEAELFGYEDGAFTGARRQGNAGLLRQADGGVLFLDEIGDMPLVLQPRLLRVLQERELTPLGGGKPVRVDFALICATHRDLQERVAQGLFRADLYYRIAHHCVRLPSLAEHPARHELIQRLWARSAAGRELEPEALERLAQYAWPGNFRQLVACLRTLVALSDPGTRVGSTALPAYVQPALPLLVPAAQPGSASARLEDLQTSAMREALQACAGNVSLAARRLGISRSTLYRRLGDLPG